MNYQPNWNKQDVRRRIRSALGFARAVLSETDARQWSTRYIDKHFGQGQKDISRYLRSKLLICHDDTYRFNQGDGRGKCKSYLLNAVGYREVMSLYLSYGQRDHDNNSLSNNSLLYTLEEKDIVREWITSEFRNDLATLEFTYTDKSQRLWHGLQSVKREYKKPALAAAGLKYQYDIVCAAPTLIQQLARMQGEDAAMPFLDQYLVDRKAIRAKLAVEADLNPKVVKQIINALLCGAQLSSNYSASSIYDLIDRDYSRLQFLKQHEYIIGIREDFKKCWDMIKYFIPRRTITTRRGYERKMPLTCGQKWFQYFQLERQVLDSVRSYLDRMGNRYFLEHDGWSSIEPVDIDDLRLYVRLNTGYDLQFEMEIVD